LFERSSLLLRIHTGENVECHFRMKLAVHDDAVALIAMLGLKEPIKNFQKRVSESVDERYLS
jgi:hypothetical protein